MYCIKLICIEKNSIQRGFFKKSTVLLIFIFLYFSFNLTSDFKSKGFLITLTISHCRTCPDSAVSNALLPLLGVLIILWLVRARYETFLHTYVHTGSIPDVGRPFTPHLLPPTSLNVVFSVLKAEKLLLIPNSASSSAIC